MNKRINVDGLRAVLGAVAAISIPTWIFLSQWLYFKRPHEPEPFTGRVWSVPFRGDEYFLTVWEYLGIMIALPLVGGLCIVGLMVTGSKRN